MAPAGFVVAASLSLDFGAADAAAITAEFSLGAGEVTAAHSTPRGGEGPEGREGSRGEGRAGEWAGGEGTAVRDGLATAGEGHGGLSESSS